MALRVLRSAVFSSVLLALLLWQSKPLLHQAHYRLGSSGSCSSSGWQSPGTLLLLLLPLYNVHAQPRDSYIHSRLLLLLLLMLMPSTPFYGTNPAPAAATAGCSSMTTCPADSAGGCWWLLLLQQLLQLLLRLLLPLLLLHLQTLNAVLNHIAATQMPSRLIR